MIATAAVVWTVLTPAYAIADDTMPAQHNITYRARVDGVARGALVTYRISDTQVNTADPTMLPARTFETTGVLTDPREAGMRISIQWPYSANLHCEILVDDQLVVQASEFIGPRLTPAKDDPDYGAINCGAPLSNALGAPAPGPAAPPADPAAVPPVDGSPVDAPPFGTPPGEAPPLDSVPPVPVPPTEPPPPGIGPIS
jgi:hypothetical protein